MSSYSIVIVSNEVPKPEPTSAGERLIREFYFALKESGHTPIFLAPKPRNGYAATYDVPRHFVDSEETVMKRFTAPLRHSLGAVPNLSFYMALRQDEKAVSLLQEAVVIDMQWSSNILLAPLFRWINPDAKLVGTFHDINEQRIKRRAAVEPDQLKTLIWSTVGSVVGVVEGLATVFLDLVIVLSDKDRFLLRSPKKFKDKVHAVIPPVYLESSKKLSTRSAGHEIVFVGTMYRWENHHAVEWFIQKVLPLIWEEKPEIEFTVVGESPSADLVQMAKDSRIKFTGFLDDIEVAYDAATLLVSPIKLGSGVKFKTLDAILRGIPVVSTTAGVEGIAKVDWVSALAEDPSTFAQKVLKVLDNYDYFVNKSLDYAIDARGIYSKESYQALIRKLYLEI